jgi:hypothetical protein
VIAGPRLLFEARCRQRGYTLDDVRGCIVSEDGDTITVDETHPAYPRAKKGVLPNALPDLPPAGGPGTELKKLLRLVGITATPSCPCNAHAVQMDIWGADECQRRLDEIVGWLREEAGRRHLPFSETVARQVVLLAIRRARKAAAH